MWAIYAFARDIQQLFIEITWIFYVTRRHQNHVAT
jgi:hypothetical protein